VRTVTQAAALPHSGQPVCVAIGVFDGVHLGHQVVLRDMLRSARHANALAAAVTFDRHPNSIVAPAQTPPLIQSLSQRLAAIAALGIDATWLIPFDFAFSQLTGEEFVRKLRHNFGRIPSIHVGDRFHFGHRRSGNVALLRRLEPELGFTTHSLPAVRVDDHIVSSTRIRQTIRSGQFATACQLLGRPYALGGQVKGGDHLGRKLGFPTANLDVNGLVLPPRGVYAAWARWSDRRAKAVVNIGFRPTVAKEPTEIRVEAHLLDIDSNTQLRGDELELEFTTRLRDEHKFDSLDHLRHQIAQDVAAARTLFARSPE
jgi:riboflavin kinase / FMN adenylyltransferase